MPWAFIRGTVFIDVIQGNDAGGGGGGGGCGGGGGGMIPPHMMPPPHPIPPHMMPPPSMFPMPPPHMMPGTGAPTMMAAFDGASAASEMFLAPRCLW